jgi:hypothetical protein
MRPWTGLARAATLLALTAAAMPASASARTQWFYERQPIAEGTTVETASSGPVKLTLKRPKLLGLRAACAASGVTALWNGPENGFDEVRSISFACTSEAGEVHVTPLGTWTSILTGTALPLTDRWSGVEVEVTIAGTDYGVFAGSLTPTMGDGDAQAGVKDDLDTELRFHGETLAGPNGDKLSFGGFYRLGPSRGHGATGEL